LPEPARKKIDFMFFDAGGGHRSAANALKAVVEQQGRPWDVRLVNFQELLDSIDVFKKITGLRLEDVYNLCLRRGWTLGSGPLLKIMHGVIRVYHGTEVRVMREFWAGGVPDLVVSVIPNFNRAMLEALRTLSTRTPYVTVITDFADYPPHFWLERQEQYVVCGTERAVAQARAMGYAPERIFATSGMILRPSFYEPVHVDRAAERARLGLKPDVPTGLVMFGGEGSREMLQIARSVDKLGVPVQLIFICGRNERLRASLAGLRTNFPKFVEGFTKEVPHYMAVSDFFIGKPGPGSITEALAMKLPVIVERNAWTLVQERYNAEWVEEKQVGVVLGSMREIDKGVNRLLAPENFARYRANAANFTNRAVFEIVEILERLLTQNPSQT
jgi:1,2-diacylglycerol 3-beta-galactosyltransferase